MQQQDNSDNNLEIPFSSFAAAELNSLSWYDLLPGDGVTISGIDDSRSAADLASLLGVVNLEENVGEIDLLAAKILNGCSSIAGFDDWPDFAFRMSQVMAQNLHAGGNRGLRMRVQRLNYYLRAMLDADIEPGKLSLLVSETLLEGSKPWDFLATTDGDWWLSSDDRKIRFRARDGEQSFWNIGLPTQIDPLPDGSLGFGSLYSEGATLLREGAWEQVAHRRPVLLVFEHESERLFLDHDGNLWLDRPRRLIFQSKRPQVHFARYCDGRLYLLDNSDFGHVTIVDMDSKRELRQPVLPVQVCNDLVATERGYYLIDKQQGSVFKFDRDWKYVDCALKFGRGAGCLLDPVAIRSYRDRLFIVSWLSARLTELEAF